MSRWPKSDLDLVVAGTSDAVADGRGRARSCPRTRCCAPSWWATAAPARDRRHHRAAEQVAKETLPLTEPPEAPRPWPQRLRRAARQVASTAYAETQKQARQARSATSRPTPRSCSRPMTPPWSRSASIRQCSRPTSCATPMLDTGKRIDGRDTRPSVRSGRGGRPAAHARHGAVHTR